MISDCYSSRIYVSHV